MWIIKASLMPGTVDKHGNYIIYSKKYRATCKLEFYIKLLYTKIFYDWVTVTKID